MHMHTKAQGKTKSKKAQSKNKSKYTRNKNATKPKHATSQKYKRPKTHEN